jgi:hypothetical protein
LLIQETFKSSPNDDTQSPEVTSKAVASAEDVDDGSSKKDVNDSVKSLMEKLSAALVNVSAKDDLARQHAKVAEEAVAGSTQIHDAWECLCLFLSSQQPTTVLCLAKALSCNGFVPLMF